jgi:branched-chain amino acid transport system substrate-binding protein
MRKAFLAAVAACALIAAGGTGQAQEKLKIGVMATLSGALTSGGEDGVRGVQLAAKQAGNKIAGREIDIIVAATDASPDSALRAARKLVEQDKVQLIIRLRRHRHARL